MWKRNALLTKVSNDLLFKHTNRSKNIYHVSIENFDYFDKYEILTGLKR